MKVSKLILFLFLFTIAENLYAQTVTLDSSFGNNGVVLTITPHSSEIQDLAVQTDGKIIAVGYSIIPMVSLTHSQLTRYHSNGILDSSFGTGGIVYIPIAYSEQPLAIDLQPDGKIIVAGFGSNTSGPYFGLVVRFNIDGSLDSSFGTGGVVTTIPSPVLSAALTSMKVQPNGKIIAGGGDNSHNFMLIRYNNDGTLDSSFGTSGVVLTFLDSSAYIMDIVLQPDGKIIAGGNTYNANANYSRFALTRYNTDGSLDSIFGIGGKVIFQFDTVQQPINPGETIISVALQSDGKIVAAGFIESGFVLARYNTNGTFDTTFGTGGWVELSTYSYPSDLIIQADSKIVVSGSSQATFNNDYGLMRFNSDGTVDSTFGNGGELITDIGSCTDYAQCLALQPDGKLIEAGSSRDSACSSPARFTLARFTTDVNIGIEDLSNPSPTLNIYPNPTKEITLIKALSFNHATLSLYDLTGRLIITEPFHNSLNLFLSSLNPGLYFVELRDNATETKGKRIVGKIVKE